MNKMEIGQQIETEVVAVTDDTVFLDLNLKSEGVLDAAELKDEGGKITVKEGDKIKVFFIGEKGGEMRFSTKIAGENADDSMLENAFKNGIPVEGHVEKEIKGGFEVKLGDKRAFCPYSQISFRKKEEAAYYIGKTLTFKIQEYKENGKNILVSARALLENEYENFKNSLKEKFSVGDRVKGTVEAIQNYGAFVDIGGFRALLPVSEISRKRIDDVSSILSVGQEIEAEIIKADWTNERVSLSMKNLTEDPWESVLSKYKIDQKVAGKIVRIADFGLFVNLEDGIDGLLHVSALELPRNANIKKLYKVGDELSVSIKDIDAKEHRISLVPAVSKNQDNSAEEYLSSQKDDGDTYNPFAALLKKK